MPWDRKRYPLDWPAISRSIRERAMGRCECPGGKDGCGLHRNRRCEEVQGTVARWAKGKVVLTVHHLDQDPSGSDPARLLALCNRCHLRMDSAMHVQHARATRRARLAVRDLFAVGAESPGQEPNGEAQAAQGRVRGAEDGTR